MRSLLAAFAALLALLLAPAAGAQQALPISPSGLPPGPAADVERSRTTLAPGVVLEQFTRIVGAERFRAHVVRANLASPGVGADLVYPGVVAKRQLLTSAVMANGAVAAINGDFFDSTKSNAPDGTAIAAGELVKSFDPISETGGARTAGLGFDGVGRLRNSAFNGELTLPGGRTPLSGFNRFRLGTDQIGLYSSRWGEHPRQRPVENSSAVRSVVVRGGRVVETRAGAPDAGTYKGPIPADGFELVGREAGAARLAGLEPGAAVGASFGATFDAPVPAPFRFAVGGVAYLVRDGKLIDEGEATGVDRPVYPRSAVGFAAGGRTMLLVTIDGRSATTTGLTRTIDFAKLLQDLGAVDAMHLDGGGSATLVARPGGAAPVVVNDPSDGREGVEAGPRQGVERAVPNGVGVFYDPTGKTAATAPAPAPPVRRVGARFTAGFTAARPSVVAARRVRLALFASRRARLTVEIRRGGRRLGRFVRRAGPGTTVALYRRPGRSLPPGSYSLRLTARTAAGETASDRATLRVRRRLG